MLSCVIYTIIDRCVCIDYLGTEKKKISELKLGCTLLFHAIMEYTGNLMQDDTHLTSSLLKMFSMFEICLSCGDDDLDIVYLKCINCKKETGLNSETGFTWVYDEVITKFVLNAKLHHVVMPWIISSEK